METKRQPARAPIGGKRDILAVKGKDPNYQYRIVNDNESRIQDLKERGYEIVTHDVQVGDKRVGTPKQEGSPVQIDVKNGLKAYLMRIKREWFEEDKKAKALEVDRSEDAIRQSTSEDGNYGKIDIVRK